MADFASRETRRCAGNSEDDIPYTASDLDRTVVAKDQIRTIVRTFSDRLFTEIFPGRGTADDVPKTLIFAKDDSHADDIVDIVRDEFGKGNDFCQKITYRSGKDPDELIPEFRNSPEFRVVVTVDMIATGTDIKPLECLCSCAMFSSRGYFEQMIGRGVRVINDADFRAVTPDATSKDGFVVVDAVGVTERDRFEDRTQPLDRKPTVGAKSLVGPRGPGQHRSRPGSRHWRAAWLVSTGGSPLPTGNGWPRWPTGSISRRSPTAW